MRKAATYLYRYEGGTFRKKRMQGNVTHVLGLNVIAELYVAHSVHNLTFNTLTMKCYVCRHRVPKHVTISYLSRIVLYKLHLLYFIKRICWLTYWRCFWTSQWNLSKHEQCISSDLVHLPRAPSHSCLVSDGRAPSRSSWDSITTQELSRPDNKYNSHSQIHFAFIEHLQSYKKS